MVPSRMLFRYIRELDRGSPLLPLLFALALEPLAARVRLSPHYVGSHCANREDKLSLYAGYTLIYLGTRLDLCH